MTDSGRRFRRGVLGSAIAVVVVLLGLAFWLSAFGTVAVKPPLPPVAAATQAESPLHEPAPASAPEPAPEPAPDAVEAPAVASHPSIERFLELSRYAPSTRRIDADTSDLLNPNIRHERRGSLPDVDGADEPGWEVHFTADRYALRGDETAEVSFELWQDGRPVVPTWFELVAQPRSGAPAKTKSLSIQRTGARYTASFQPQQYWSEHLGTVRVTARFEAPGLSQKSGSLTFYFTSSKHLPAALTGDFDDWLLGGDLAIGVGIDVRTAGTYRLEGNLYDSYGAPVAWARFQGALSPGEQEVNLVFDGLVFRDSGIRPPYVLRKLRGYRMRPGDAPHREDLKSYSGEYRVQNRYVLDDFRGRPVAAARSREMVSRYEDALARGVRLTAPRN